MDTHRQQRLEVGMEVDGYRLEEKLHTGGMAALWRVMDLKARHKEENLSAKPFEVLVVEIK